MMLSYRNAPNFISKAHRPIQQVVAPETTEYELRVGVSVNFFFLEDDWHLIHLPLACFQI